MQEAACSRPAAFQCIFSRDVVLFPVPAALVASRGAMLSTAQLGQPTSAVSRRLSAQCSNFRQFLSLLANTPCVLVLPCLALVARHTAPFSKLPTMARTRQTARRSTGGRAPRRAAGAPARGNTMQSSSAQSITCRTVPPKAAISDDDLLKLGLETVRGIGGVAPLRTPLPGRYLGQHALFSFQGLTVTPCIRRC